MAVKGYFYNSINADRKYNGQDMNEDKAPFYKEGVCFGQLGVTATGETMTIEVDGGEKTGYAYLNKHTVHNTTVLELTVTQASGTFPRIDRVILQNSEIDRMPNIFLREGEYSSSPQPPELVNNITVQEKCLAEIYVPAGAVRITQANITDTRANPDLCGFVASQFADVDFSVFATQFEAWVTEFKRNYGDEMDNWTQEQKDEMTATMDELEANFDRWFDDIQEQLSDDAAANLYNNKINIVVAESDIPVSLRKPKTFYFRVLEKAQVIDTNVVVSPTMGIIIK